MKKVKAIRYAESPRVALRAHMDRTGHEWARIIKEHDKYIVAEIYKDEEVRNIEGMYYIEDFPTFMEPVEMR